MSTELEGTYFRNLTERFSANGGQFMVIHDPVKVKDYKMKFSTFLTLVNAASGDKEVFLVEDVINTGNNYTGDNSFLTSYSQDSVIVFTPSATNTGTSNLNIQSIGNLPIKKFNGTSIVDVVAGDLNVNNTYVLLPKDTYFLIVSGANTGTTSIAGFIQAGTNVVITGAGTIVSPYIISSSGGGGGGSSSFITLLDVPNSYTGAANKLVRVNNAANGLEFFTAPYLTSISSSDVTSALGYTPYNATNPNGYITASSASALTNKTGNISQWTNDSAYITASALTGYEILSNKVTDFTTKNNTKYPSTLAVDNGFVRLTGDNRISGDLLSTSSTFTVGKVTGGQSIYQSNLANLYVSNGSKQASIITDISSAPFVVLNATDSGVVGSTRNFYATAGSNFSAAGAIIVYDASRLTEIAGSIHALTSREYVDSKLVGRAISSILATPTITQNGYAITWDNTSSNFTLSAIAGGGGTVTTISIASANGFAGSSTGGATPALTLSTTVTGLLKGNGTAISAAIGGTDYVSPSDASYVKSVILNTPNVLFSTPVTFVTSTNTATGTLTLNSQTAGYALMAPLISNGTPAFRRPQESDFSTDLGGVLFSDDFTRADNASLGANYTQTGTTMSILSNKLRMTNASGSLVWTNKAQITSISKSNLENFEVVGAFTVPTLSSTSFGVSIGFESTTLPTYGQSFEVRFCMETANQGKILFYRNQVVTATIPVTNSTLSITAGNSTTFKIVVNKTEVIVVWTNTTTGLSLTQTVAFELGRTSVVVTAMANTHYVTLFSHGGTIDFDDFSITSTTKKGGVWMLGDSITYGYSAGDVSKRTIDILGRNYVGNFTAFSSANLRIEELTSCVSIIATHLPDEILMAAGVNNLRASESAATIVGRVTSFLTALNALTSNYYTSGVNFFVCALVPQSANDVTATNALLASTFGSGYIDTDTPLRTNGTSTPNADLYNVDGIHPNPRGFQRKGKAIAVKRGYKLKNQVTTNDYTVRAQENGYVAIGDVTPQTALDIVDTKSQIRVSSTTWSATDVGGYLTSRSSAVLMSFAGYFDGTNYIAKSTSNSFIACGGGYVATYANTGSTVGGILAPTEITRTTGTGLGVFTTTPNYALEVIGNATQLRLSTSSSDSNSAGFIRGFVGGITIGTSPYNGTSVVARSTSEAFVSINNSSGFVYYANTGLIATNAFTPTAKVTIDLNGNVGIGQTTPTARLHLLAGTATAGTAPEKYTAGTLLTTIEALTQEASASSRYQSTVALNRYAMGGKIYGTTTDVSNTSTTETDLVTYTTKASTLAATDESLVFDLAGTFNDITATCQLRFYFAGTLIGDTGLLTVSATGGWSARIIVIRSGASTAKATLTVTTPTASTATYTNTSSLTSLTFTNTNIIKCTGTAAGASGGTGDITLSAATLMWWGASSN